MLPPIQQELGTPGISSVKWMKQLQKDSCKMLKTTKGVPEVLILPENIEKNHVVLSSTQPQI